MIKIFLFLILSSCFLTSPASAKSRDPLSQYVYEDNKRLVTLVNGAASLIENKGEEAFKEFGRLNSVWLNEKSYIFVYDSAGICVFHPIETSFVGRDLSKYKDIEGRPVIALITEIGKRPDPEAGGWVFYLWEGPWHSYPHWKGSFIRKAVAPDGKVYAVGSGLYNIKIEKSFIQERVDKAVELILAKGKDAAFAELGDRSCPLHILDTYISVVNEKGDVIVDPLFPNLDKKRNIMQYCDSTGKNLAEEVQNSLKDKDRVWLLYIGPKTDTSRPVRHLRYTRKVTIGKETFYVTASFMPATPVWMKQ